MSRLRRAAALEIRPSDVGPIWGALSAVLTDAARRFAEGVSVRCYPKASSDAPGCCYTDIGTILLDGELISEPEGLGRGSLNAQQRGELAALVGVLVHECGHAVHSLPATMRALADAGYLGEATVLEEARMERRLCERHPVARRFIRAAVRKINAPHLPPTGTTLDRASAAGMVAILGGRVHAGTLPAAVAATVYELAERALGRDDAAELGRIVAAAAAAGDDDVGTLMDACRRYRELVGEPPEQQVVVLSADAAEALSEALAACESEGQTGLGEGDGSDRGEDAAGAAAREVLEAVGSALTAERSDAEERAAARARTLLAGRSGRDAGKPGGENPGAAPGEHAGAVEKAAARELERRLRRARARRTAREGSPVPGRFHSAGAVRRQAERTLGRPPRSEPFRRRVEVDAPLWAPEVAIIVDNSGSMSRHWVELGRIAWISHEAVRRLGGRCAISVFGASAAVVGRARERLRRVPEFHTGGGTGYLAEAIELATAELRIDDPRRPRLVLIVSDGELYGTETARPLIARLERRGAGVVHIGIGAPPGDLGAERQVVVADALDVGEVAGHACIEALAGARGVR